MVLFCFVEMFVDDSDVLVEAEDGSCQQERLRHIVEQPCGHIVDLDHLIRHECDTAHNEQHRTGVLRDFEAFVVFHGVKRTTNYTNLTDFFSALHHSGTTGCTEDKGDDVTDRLKDRLNCLVHNF